MSIDTKRLDRQLRDAMKLNAAAEASIEAERIRQLQHDVRIHDGMTVKQIGEMCAALSTFEHEVQARIECIGQKPVAYLVRVPAEMLPPTYLRHAAR